MEELQEVLIQVEEVQSEQEFIEEIYELAKRYSKRQEAGIFASDFLFHMIPTNSGVYWMSVDHPVAKMLKENNFKDRGTFSGELGCIVVHDEYSVNTCIDAIVELCQKYKLKINE
jgi:hypothetical protein